MALLPLKTSKVKRIGYRQRKFENNNPLLGTGEKFQRGDHLVPSFFTRKVKKLILFSAHSRPGPSEQVPRMVFPELPFLQSL